ncbi:hypothetical protein [Agrobacterium pusense]|uniref:hypothetical protein n=1 Tax=Agrobacterium pusense TaxID=648995 RepID=UPI000D1BD066|nr:hypothetical protein [Agrobacterium pusense]
MSVMKVYFDTSGKIINIGEWDFMEETVFVEEDFETEEEGESSVLGADGNPLTKSVRVVNKKIVERVIQRNPLPDGAFESTADIVEGWDGGLYTSDDPRRLAPIGR